MVHILPKRIASKSHRGIAMVAVLALFAIATILFVTWTRGALLRSQSQKLEHEQVQTSWLVDAGLQRAMAKLRLDNAYAGETWRISANELEQISAAEVLIEVGQLAEAEEKFTISVQANLPPGNERHVRQSRILQFSKKAVEEQ